MLRATRPARTGYFAIGIFQPKREINLGTLWRSAASLGATYTFQIGMRFNPQSSDTVKSWRMMPHFVFDDFDSFYKTIPYSCPVTAIELSDKAVDLIEYQHHPRSIYLLGAEDTGIPDKVLEQCHDIVQIPGQFCLNVAVAGSIVIYDRIMKQGSTNA